MKPSMLDILTTASALIRLAVTHLHGYGSESLTANICAHTRTLYDQVAEWAGAPTIDEKLSRVHALEARIHDFETTQTR